MNEFERRVSESREMRLLDLPGYSEWSRSHRLEYPEALAYLDGLTALIHPDEAAGPHDRLFEELYQEVLTDFGLDVGEEASFELNDLESA